VGERRWKKSPDEEVQPPKTVWDWLQLLIVPAMLAAIALAYNSAQASREHRREDRSAQDATLLAYFTQEGDLMLKRKLLPGHPKAPAAKVARTITLATVRRLDGRRKAEVVRFLAEAKLLDATSPVVDLKDADLSRLNLVGALLTNISFAHADLRGARFDGATLTRLSFAEADLSGASFRGASLGSVEFRQAKLNGAHFDGAKIGRSSDDALGPPTSFFSACLSKTSFVDAYLGNATDFRLTQGGRVDFRRAHAPRLRTIASEAQRVNPTIAIPEQKGACSPTLVGPDRPGIDVRQ
jgi:uncharacterized protein YjbI with pentapeptide repeats